MLSLARPTASQIADRLLTICRAEGIQTDKPAMEKLAESTHGDLRQALHMLQLWGTTVSGPVTFNDVKARTAAGKGVACVCVSDGC